MHYVFFFISFESIFSVPEQLEYTVYTEWNAREKWTENVCVEEELEDWRGGTIKTKTSMRITSAFDEDVVVLAGDEDDDDDNTHAHTHYLVSSIHRING